MLSDMDGNLLSLLLMGVHENPLDEVVTVLIASDVDEWNSRSFWVGCCDDIQITVEELNSANLETFLDNL